MWVVHHINCIALHVNDLGYGFIPIDCIALDWTSVFHFFQAKCHTTRRSMSYIQTCDRESEWLIPQIHSIPCMNLCVSVSKHTILEECGFCTLQLNHVSLDVFNMFSLLLQLHWFPFNILFIVCFQTET